MADHRMDRTNGDYERSREDAFDRWAHQNYRRQADYRHSDYRNRANMSSSNMSGGYGSTGDRYAGERYTNRDDRETRRHDNDHDTRGRDFWSRSVDEVRSWFGDEEAERRRLMDEEERARHDRNAAYHNHSYRDDSDRNHSRGDWNSSRGYGSNIDRDYDQRSFGTSRQVGDRSGFRSSNNYGGPRNSDFYRDYPTHNGGGRSRWNNEDDEMKHGYESQFDYHESDRNRNNERLFGGRDYERNYPTRAERNEHTHDLSEGWQSNDSYRGYRSLNNTGRSGISQDNQLGREKSSEPNYRDQNYSRGDYSVNMNAGGQEYNSRHYNDRDRPGTRLNEYGQQGYSQGYGRTSYSVDHPTGEYTNSETLTRGMSARSMSTRSPKNYRGSDERIQVEVCEALGDAMDASEIEVSTSGSEVTLTGSVTSREEKRRAERIAESVRGVEDVHNQLSVKESSNTSNSYSSTTNASSDTEYATNRSAAQSGNSSRTDLTTDGSSQTDGASGSTGSTNGRNTANGNGSANGSSRSSARRS